MGLGCGAAEGRLAHAAEAAPVLVDSDRVDAAAELALVLAAVGAQLVQPLRQSDRAVLVRVRVRVGVGIRVRVRARVSLGLG